ncbi:MAG: hypothetical protein KZQ73_05620 [Candidatus Thiodiazotropha sp. (ex Semelilucina semeliformis)]|nr:hypothetical protein [Candidatus Thiodiazotropha sp. (ex Semelilucina semeliformis)]
MIISIPEKKKILEDSVTVPIAPKGSSWYQKCLGDHASEKGVYIIHYRNSIKYVGKTSGKSMSFGMRLRRHFQETAAGSKHTYPKLAKLKPPPAIKVKLIPLKEIKKYIQHDLKAVNELELIPLFEAALILSLKPKFQC